MEEIVSIQGGQGGLAFHPEEVGAEMRMFFLSRDYFRFSMLGHN